MDFSDLINSETDNKLKCFSCHNYLSYFPIFLCVNSQSICGRCTVSPEFPSLRNEPLEAVCQLIKFPCRYNTEGCLEQFFPKDIPQHEQTCKYRTISCLITKSEACQWRGSLPNLSKHCQNEHSDLILNEGLFVIDVSESKETQSLLRWKDSFLVFERKFDSSELVCEFGVYKNQYDCALEVAPLRLTLQSGAISLCLDFNARNFDKQVFTKLSLQSLKAGDNEQISCKITPHKSETNPPSNELILKEILDVFVCSNCENFAMPPIHRRTKNLEMSCCSCRPLFVRTCTKCYRVSQKSDAVLNKIAEVLIYPCPYRSNGCSWTSKYQDVLVHQLTCEYLSVECISGEGCQWKGGNNSLNSHIYQAHADQFVDSHQTFDLPASFQQKFFKFSNHLFRLVHVSEGKLFKWCVQKVGRSEAAFKYEVRVFDGVEMVAVMRKICLEFVQSEEVFAEASEYCSLERRQICGANAGEGRTGGFRVCIFR